MIWQFKDANAKDTADVNLGGYKCTGKFYEDALEVTKLLGIELHPALREPTWEIEKNEIEKRLEEAADDEEVKEEKVVTTIKFDRHRIDKNTLKALFHILPTSSVHTLKFSNNGFTPTQFDELVEYLRSDACTAPNIYLDWNPIYKENFRDLPPIDSPEYEYADDETHHITKL